MHPIVDWIAALCSGLACALLIRRAIPRSLVINWIYIALAATGAAFCALYITSALSIIPIGPSITRPLGVVLWALVAAEQIISTRHAAK